jgi:hypothetical protein
MREDRWMRAMRSSVWGLPSATVRLMSLVTVRPLASQAAIDRM